MEDTVYVGVRLSKATHDALRKRQRDSKVEVSLSAVIRHLLDESLGVKNGKRRK